MVYTLKAFDRWLRKSGLTDDDLRSVAADLDRGLVDAELGGGVYKQRVARPGRGKSGSYRVFLLFRAADRLVFLSAIAKKDADNISIADLRALKGLATDLAAATREELALAAEGGAIRRIE